MTPQFLPPPEVAVAQPPVWAVAASLVCSVLFAAGFTFVMLPV